MNEIYLSLRAHLNDLANKPAIAYIGKAYTPTTGTPYIQESFFPATPEYGIGYDDFVDQAGLYQLEVMTPIGQETAWRTLGQSVADHFKRGRYTDFEISRVEWGNPVADGAFMNTRIDVYWRVLS